MKEFVPLLQTVFWIAAVFALLFYFRKEIELVRKILTKRLESGSPIKIGPLEIGELRERVDTVKNELTSLNKKVSSLFLTTMSPYMYSNLKKFSSGNFGKYAISKGLKRELYHLRDIGYIEIKSITSIPKDGNNLSDFIKVTPTGKLFVELRENIDNDQKA